MSMRDKVRVLNKGDATYAEEFLGKTISIAPGKYVEMPRYEAAQFMGTMSKPLPNGGWVEKRLVIEEIPGQPKPIECEFCGKKYGTKAMLEQHLDKEHAEQLAERK